jgi:predicted nucleic acid-binding protein
MRRTFVDAGVLIAAAREETEIGLRALQLLDDPEREFVSSDFVKLEVLPKAIYNRMSDEAGFYESFFASVVDWGHSARDMTDQAYQIACTYGLQAVDSLHVAAALMTKCDELVTSEKKSKPIHRANRILCVVSMRRGGDQP